GKSIIINAVNLLLGSRASASLIRTGAESAELEALFDIAAASRAATAMAAAGYDPSEGLLVRRIISSNDRHRIFINGRLATMQVLAGITDQLASISGQHAHQGLLREEAHVQILDQFGGITALRDDYATQFNRLQPLIRRERELLEQQARQGEQIELWRFQRQEIETAAPEPDEDETLAQERLRLRHGETLSQIVQRSVETLYSADGAVFETLGALAKELTRLSAMDGQLVSTASELEEMSFRVEDLAARLRDYLRQIDLEPGRLEKVEERLDQLNRLKRKYGGDLVAVLRHARQIDGWLADMERLDEDIQAARDALADGHARVCALAEKLAEARRAAGKSLAKQVEKELAALKMGGTCFAVAVEALPAAADTSPYLVWKGHALTENGADRAAFMLAPNVGEAIKPLAAIASGGELSRVVLALKAILAGNDALEMVVFDEVDAGIGGGTADVVGRKLLALAEHHQILCITHLPQIARYGHRHLRIVKSVNQGRTHTTITPLDEAARVLEMARMLGGEKITEKTMAHAREMLEIK
ncbi:MAG: DNA repair protein RecN, partial [Desulfatitalea sp.]|nr:DNA repair protein RecN [Desulfatitalea sp.]NNK00859.1 DNA repair protein RecN [Desulfatitalea sp.]